LCVAEFFFTQSDERPRVDSVEKFLIVQRNPNNVDGPEPFFDFGLGSLTFVNQECGVENLLLFVLRQPTKVLLHPVLISNGELPCDETTKACNPLLAIENLKTSIY
jgi:hypothetical protein